MVAIRFGSFVLDPETEQLKGDEGTIHLSPKAFHVLEYLVRQRPRVVPKADLLDEVWPDVHVEEQNLKNLVVEIRRALGDNAAEPRFIRNAFGRGYAFCGETWETDLRRSATLGHLVSLTGDRSYPVRVGENLIGRDPACSIVLDLSGVSRRHAKITALEGTFRLEDLDSKNSTWVNGEPIEMSIGIEDGDAIRIGRSNLIFRVSKDQDSTSTIIDR